MHCPIPLKMLARFAAGLSAACVLFVLATSAVAANLYWDINGATAGSGNSGGNWDSGTNWSTDSAGAIATGGWTDGEAAVFSAGTDGTSAWTVTIAGTVDPSSISFEENGNKTISGGGITTAGGLSISSAGRSNSNNYNINSQLTGTGALTLAANGNTSDTGGSEGGNLYLGNSGNNFVGGIAINSGVVSFNGDGAFGDAANVITINGGGLVATSSRTLNHNIALAGGGDKIFRSYGSATFTHNGTITGTGNVRHTDGGTLALNGNLTHTGNVYNAAGTLALAGTGNAYTGYAHVVNSTIRLDASGAIPDTSDVLQYFNGTFNVNGKTETIRSALVGSAGDTSATLNIGGGNLTVLRATAAAGAPTNIGGSYYAKITGTGTINYSNTASINETWDWLNSANDFNGSIIVSGGRLRVPGDSYLGNAANDLTFNGAPTASTANGAGTASMQITSGGNLTLEAGRDIVLNSGKEGTMYTWGGYTMTVNGKVTGAGQLRKEDSGTLLLNNTANDYGGKTTIVRGEIKLGASGVLPDGTTVQIGADDQTPTLNLNGFAETIAGLTDGGKTNGRVTGNGGALTVAGGGTYSFSGVVQNGSGATAFTKSGGGTQTLAGANTYTGNTTVSGGTLALLTATTNNIASSPQIDLASTGTLDVTGVTGSGGFALASGQILSGTGTVTGDLTVSSGAFIQPGTSPGILTVNGDLSIAGTYTADLAGNTAGTGYDQLLLSTGTQNVSLGGTLADNFSGSSWSSLGDTLWIVKNDTNGTLTGTFSNYATNGQSIGSYDGKLWQIWYGADFASTALSGGNDVALFAVAVPEPGAFAMLLFGSVPFWVLGRKRRGR